MMKADKIAHWKQLFEKADEAGRKAYELNVPNPVVFGEAESLFSDKIKPGTESVCMDGLCGFAWIVIKPGNHPFAKWLKETKNGSEHVYGGVTVSASRGGRSQSMERKEAYAKAFARVIQEDELFVASTKKKPRVFVESRLD